jgi:hypothetical protein
VLHGSIWNMIRHTTVTKKVVGVFVRFRALHPTGSVAVPTDKS